MSGTNWTQTPNYGLYKPIPNADNDTWGDHLNANADTLDTLIKNVSNTAGVVTWNTRSGAVTMQAADISAVGGALLAGPVFTGNPTCPTPSPNDNSTKLATTAFVLGQASGASPQMNGTAAAGSATMFARGDHVHPTDTSRAAQTSLANYLPLAGGILTGGITGTAATFTGVVEVDNYVTQKQVSNHAMSLWGGPDTALYLADSTGTPKGLFSWTSSNSEVAIHSYVAGGDLKIDAATHFVSTCTQQYCPGGGPWNSSSDARIKTVHADYGTGLEAILALEPVVYSYRGNDGDAGASPHAKAAEEGARFVGLVAQAVEAVMPEMVTRRAGVIDGIAVDDFRDLNTGPLIYALVNAVKELAARIGELESQAPPTQEA